MDFKAKWITAENGTDICPIFRKKWSLTGPVLSAELYITCIGVYEAMLNGKRVGKFVLAPGWTSYGKRLQVQRYDVTELLTEENELQVTVGKGWALSPMPGFVDAPEKARRLQGRRALLAELTLHYAGGGVERVFTDETWQWAESEVRFSEIYDGERADATWKAAEWYAVGIADLPMDNLIGQEGEEIREMERLPARELLRTPAGETVVDFGQEVTGYVEFTVDAQAGDPVRILHGEMLDREGNFYNANYRTAKAELSYICRQGRQTWHPRFTFFGFRYLKLDAFPGEPDKSQFTAIAVYSNMKRTGHIETSDPELNQLISNIFWSQKDNFLDVPTDCPQRDERLGWTGDAQVFIKAASYNFDAERFFTKWLHDLAACQRPDGSVGHVIPDCMEDAAPSAAWADAATICPWQIYETYGNESILRDQFRSMKAWVDYITKATATPFLWTGGTHFGDWLGLDAPAGSYKGSSREDLIASAFYAHSAELVIRAGRVLGEDVSGYITLRAGIVAAFRKAFPRYVTQTEHILAIWFALAPDPQATADELVRLIEADGRMRTGFVGTPYLLHVLSRYGHSELAWSLLLRREYPSWLYPVTRGATTIWEHWDGILPDGSFWSPDMNSFNHYAYGSVADWLYEEAAGIKPGRPGFAEIIVEPKPDRRLAWLEASLETRHGLVKSRWEWKGDALQYTVSVPVPARVRLPWGAYDVQPGTYAFTHSREKPRGQ